MKVGKIRIRPALLAELIGLQEGHALCGFDVSTDGDLLMYVTGPSMPDVEPVPATVDPATQDETAEERNSRVKQVVLRYDATAAVEQNVIVRRMTVRWDHDPSTTWSFPWASVRKCQA